MARFGAQCQRVPPEHAPAWMLPSCAHRAVGSSTVWEGKAQNWLEHQQQIEMIIVCLAGFFFSSCSQQKHQLLFEQGEGEKKLSIWGGDALLLTL